MFETAFLNCIIMRRNFEVIYLCVVVNRMMFSCLNITEKNEIGFRVPRGSVDF